MCILFFINALTGYYELIKRVLLSIAFQRGKHKSVKGGRGGTGKNRGMAEDSLAACHCAASLIEHEA